MRLDCSILLKQAHVNKYHNPDMWHDNTVAVKAWGSPGMFCILYSSFWLDSHFCEFWLTESYKSVCSHCIVEKNYTTITILGAVGFFGEQLPPRYSFIHYCDNVPNVASQYVLATRISPVCLILFHFTHFFDRGAVLLHSWCRSTCMVVVYQDGPQLG